MGVTKQDINASEAIWEFFSQFELNGLVNDRHVRSEVQQIEIYPNPAADVLPIQETGAGICNGESSFYVFNNVFRQVMSGKMNGSFHKMDVAALQPGIYYLTVVRDVQRLQRRYILSLLVAHISFQNRQTFP